MATSAAASSATPPRTCPWANTRAPVTHSMRCAPAAPRPPASGGVVEHGDKRGRQLGYPTANLSLGKYLRPRYGIYAVRARLADGSVVDGVANLGVRPTFDPPKELFEPHFF